MPQYFTHAKQESLFASTSDLGFEIPTIIVEYHIKKGWIVNVDARGIHYDSTIYNDPTKFIPSRFDVSLIF